MYLFLCHCHNDDIIPLTLRAGTEFAAEVFDWMNEDLVKWVSLSSRAQWNVNSSFIYPFSSLLPDSSPSCCEKTYQ